jgi:hypothetical protein
MRCYFMRGGHIAAVEEIVGLSDEGAVEKSREMFEARKEESQYDGFEVWERSRVIIQYPPALTKSDLLADNPI